MKKVLVSLIAVLLIFAGCESGNQRFADVRVTVDSGNVTRTIMPDDSEILVASYKVFYQMEGSSEIKSLPFTGKSVLLENLPVGNWTMHVEGLNAAGESVATSSERMVVVADSGAAPELFRLAYRNAEQGTFSISVKVPASSTEADSVKIFLEGAKGSSAPSEITIDTGSESGNYRTYSIDQKLDAGHYDISIEVQDSYGSRIGIPYMESLHIYENRTSSLEITWADGIFRKAAAPKFSVEASETHIDGDTLEITAEDGATVYYTLDGTKPDRNSDVYSSPITLDRNMVVRAYATMPGMVRSEYIRGDFKVQAKAPEFNHASGTYDDPVSVALSTGSLSADIYYTLDGSEPSLEHGTRYTVPFTVSTPTTVKAVSVKSGLENSAVVQMDYAFSRQNGHIEVVGPEYYTLNVTRPLGYEPDHELRIGSTWVFKAEIAPLCNSVEYEWYLDSECIVGESGSILVLSDHVSTEGVYRLTLKVLAGSSCFTENFDIYVIR